MMSVRPTALTFSEDGDTISLLLTLAPSIRNGLSQSLTREC